MVPYDFFFFKSVGRKYWKGRVGYQGKYRGFSSSVLIGCIFYEHGVHVYHDATAEASTSVSLRHNRSVHDTNILMHNS